MNTTQHSRVLDADEAEKMGQELDAIRLEVMADLGQRDADHIRRVVRICRSTEAGGRVLLHFGFDPVTFVAGTMLLGVSKILDNMEIGHNIMHGQYDWTGDPELDGESYEWDIACDSDHWRNYHNFEHHTFTNILGKDRDIGYALLRVCPEQPWHPVYMGQLLSAAWLAANFQWGVGAHDVHVEEMWQGKVGLGETAKRARPFLKKAAWQLAKDYAFYPALAGINAPRVAAGNLVANLTRNLWTFGVIFCGHFPDGAVIYDEEEVEDESRGQWYARQIGGSVNIDGGKLFDVMTGHLSHQIEHHLFPDMPAARYPEIADKVQAVCERYDQRYNTGSFGRQIASVIGKIARHSLPSVPATRRRLEPVYDGVETQGRDQSNTEAVTASPLLRMARNLARRPARAAHR